MCDECAVAMPPHLCFVCVVGYIEEEMVLVQRLREPCGIM